MSDRGLTTAALPRHVDAVCSLTFVSEPLKAALRSVHTLVIRRNGLRSLDARLLAPLLALRWLDISHNHIERLCPVGVGMCLAQLSSVVLTEHPHSPTPASLKQWLLLAHV